MLFAADVAAGIKSDGQLEAMRRARIENAGVVVNHPMDPGVAGRIEALKASIPEATLAGLEADARALTPAGVLAMLGS